MTELWLPGPHDSFVEALHRQITRFCQEHGASTVEAELRDGATFTISAVSAEPGGGFVTLSPREDEPRIVVVPLVSLARITISSVDDDHPLGFAVPLPT